MGRASSKENKNIYQICREGCGYTRAQASEALEWISDSRIEKIESDKVTPSPEEIVAMQKAYKKPTLCSYYCTHECAIGKSKNLQEVKEKSISETVLEILATLNTLNKQKDRLVEITCDGRIDDDIELQDFVAIQKQLDRILTTTESLKAWVDASVATGEIDEEKLKKFMSEK